MVFHHRHCRVCSVSIKKVGSRVYGFANTPSLEDAAAAIGALQGHVLNGVSLSLQHSKEHKGTSKKEAKCTRSLMVGSPKPASSKSDGGVFNELTDIKAPPPDKKISAPAQDNARVRGEVKKRKLQYSERKELMTPFE